MTAWDEDVVTDELICFRLRRATQVKDESISVIPMGPTGPRGPIKIPWERENHFSFVPMENARREWNGMKTLHFSFRTQSKLISPCILLKSKKVQERPVLEKSDPIYTVFRKSHPFSVAKTWLRIIQFQQFSVAAYPKKFATKIRMFTHHTCLLCWYHTL